MKFDPDCYICNANRHTCPGCGDATDHEIITCRMCRNTSLCGEQWRPCYKGMAWNLDGYEVTCPDCVTLARICLEVMFHLPLTYINGEWWFESVFAL